MTAANAPRPFILRRSADHTAVSGADDVAEGVLFNDGTTVIRWRGSRASTVVWASLNDALAVHGHDGATRPVFADEPPAAQPHSSRPTASTITDDQLDRLHKQRDFFAHAAERAEAALDRVRDLAHRMRAGSPCGAAAVYAERIEQALDGREQQ
ncbi:hypothetical protein [Streptomyces cacaoi]|uniref:hypothetical protein n=1 Tax=Streptomyces cacaoi TaxID=1898 RepID=UPI003748F867